MMRSVEDAVSSVLAAAHPRLRERCSESNIISVLEDDCGAPQAAADCDVLREQRRRKFSRLRGASSGASHGASPSF